MAIPFNSAVGNLFNCIGKCGNLVKAMSAYQAAQLINQTDTANGVVAQLDAESDIQAMVGDSYVGNLGAPESVCGTAQQVAQAYLNRIVFRDSPLPGQTLQNSVTLPAIREVIRQMQLAGATVLAQTVTATPSSNPVFTGTGDGAIAASTKRGSDGRVLENSFAETVTVTCSSDSYTGGATAGNEPFTVRGQGAQTDLFAFNWPLGSGCSAASQAINGSASNSQGNVLTNSDFETWASGLPSKFTLVTGTAGVDFAQETTLIYSGASALRLIGTAGAVLTQFRQRFGSAVGTLGALTPQTQYGVGIWLRCGPVVPGAGTLAFDLVDQNGTVVNDAAGTPNTFSIALTGLNTVYAPYTGAFRTPVVMPSQTYLRMRLTVAITSGAVVYLDRLGMGLTTQIYASGISLAVFSGATPFVAGTYASVAVANSRGAAGTLATFQTLLARLLDPFVYVNGIVFPSAASPSISDTLIN